MTALAGKTLLYTYDDGAIFRTSFVDGGSLRWEAVAGPTKGASGQEKFARRDVADGIVFLHWIEQDGLAVAQVVNLDAGSVSTALIFPPKGAAKPESIVATGTVRFV